MNNKQYYIKLIGAILLSIFFSQFAVTLIFPTKSPRIRPRLISYIMTRLIQSIPSIPNMIPKINVSHNIATVTSHQNNSQTRSVLAKEALKDIPFNTTSKGIYEKSDANFSYTLVKEKEVNWQQTMVTVNGQKVKVFVPEGEQKPTGFKL